MRLKPVILVLFCLCGNLLADPVRTLPFEYRDGLIWVAVESAGRSLHFVLDSGAESTVLNLETARQLGVKLGGAQTVQTVQSRAVACRARGFIANVTGIPLCCDPLAMDLTRVSLSCTRRIDGLIGREFFRGRIVQIDYKARCIRVLEKSVPGPCCAANLPLQLHNEAMCVPISVDGGNPRWIRLDTGCDDGLHWVAGRSKNSRAKAASVAFSHSQNESSLTTVRFGNESVQAVRTVFHSDPIFEGEAGLLGNGILSKYKVTIDSVSRRLLLEK
jgi:hypothetical protein